MALQDRDGLFRALNRIVELAQSIGSRRAITFRNAIRSLNGYNPVPTGRSLIQIPGIGPVIQRCVEQFLREGRMTYLEDLENEVAARRGTNVPSNPVIIPQPVSPIVKVDDEISFNSSIHDHMIKIIPSTEPIEIPQGLV